MRPRGWLCAAVAATVLAALAPSTSGATPSAPSTLTVSIPGPFTGCNYFNHATNDSLRAVLDLTRPSAFATSPAGQTVGANGPIEQAQLVSLAPQTVVYTLSPNWRWSNGLTFDGNDLLYWYQHAVTQPTSLSDGYRDISSVSVASNLDQVTVVFTSPFANWNTLFRDVSERGTPSTCTLRSLATQPSLGPYRLVSITSARALLVRDPLWQGAPPPYAAVTLEADATARTLPRAPLVFFGYSTAMGELTSLASRTNMEGRTGSSTQVMVVGFSPHRAATAQLAVRQYLSLALARQSLINQLAGPVNYNVGLADSVIYAQGQQHYPGSRGVGPYTQTSFVPQTTFPTAVGTDCTVCAAPILADAGYRLANGKWLDPAGGRFAITVSVGPTAVDRATATLVDAQWRADGVTVRRAGAPSDVAVAAALANGHSDVGIMTVAAGVEPFITARSWTGKNYGNDFDLGWRSPQIDQWYAAAQDTFNPVDAEGNYSDIDQYITTQAWERPLFTQPSVLMWSSDVLGLVTTSSLFGLVDQIPTLGTTATN